MKLSIITPSFNQVEFIERTIQSVISQAGNFDLEYIIIDGQSTDGTVDIIRSFAEQDTRIIWKSEPDSGQSNAINKGLAMASGDVIAYLNSDDVYLPHALQQVVENFQLYPDTMWVYGKCQIINEHDQVIKRIITAYKNFFLQKYNYSTLLILNYISQPATFWKKGVIEKIGVFNEREHMVMDYEYWLRIGKEFHPRVINEYIAGFRSYNTNKSSRRFVEQFGSEYRVAQKYTKNRMLLALHKIHAELVIASYKLLG